MRTRKFTRIYKFIFVSTNTVILAISFYILFFGGRNTKWGYQLMASLCPLLNICFLLKNLNFYLHLVNKSTDWFLLGIIDTLMLKLQNGIPFIMCSWTLLTHWQVFVLQLLFNCPADLGVARTLTNYASSWVPWHLYNKNFSDKDSCSSSL